MAEILTSSILESIVNQRGPVTSENRPDFIPYLASRSCAQIWLTSDITDFTRHTHRELEFKLKTSSDSSITVNKKIKTLIPPVSFICKIYIHHVSHQWMCEVINVEMKGHIKKYILQQSSVSRRSTFPGKGLIKHHHPHELWWSLFQHVTWKTRLIPGSDAV